MAFLSRFEETIGWYPKGMNREERDLVRKIDLLVLVYACLAFFTKYLDVSALTNAYVSGMKEDLSLSGDRLNYITAAYEVGYVVFQIPSNMLLTKLPAQYYLPAAEIFWGLFTLGTAFVTNYNQLVVMRFFVGLSASSCYVGCVHVINTWYRKKELGRRNALFWIAFPFGTMFAGYLQAAAYTNLNNVHGMEGWRWLFIVCAIITIPISGIGFTFFPDLPERTRSRWLTQSQRELARHRIEEDGFRPSLGLNRTLWRRVFGKWEFYTFVFLGGLFSNCVYGFGTPFILWLKSDLKYSTAEVNNLSTVSSAAAAVSALLFSFIIDYRGKRWEPAIFAGVLMVFSNLVLVIWDVPRGLKFFAYISLGASLGTGPALVTWMTDSLAGDFEVRGILFASMNVLGEVTALVVPLVAWLVSSAPKFHGGFIWATCISILFLLILGAIVYSQHRQAVKAEIGDSETVEEVSVTLQNDEKLRVDSRV